MAKKKKKPSGKKLKKDARRGYGFVALEQEKGKLKEKY